MRLDRLIARQTELGRRAIREKLASGSVRVNGAETAERNGQRDIGPFDTVWLDGEVLQQRMARYLLMNKPAGILSATVDPVHRTVIDLVEEPWADELHLAGRLDRATTGLMILTNDSGFSESLTEPEAVVPKTYRVTTDLPISDEICDAFETGIPFAKENIVTQPAKVERLASCETRLTIYEGKHHQIKRMFARFDVKVVALHRESIGPFHLPSDLPAGKYRSFQPTEDFFKCQPRKIKSILTN